MGDLPLKYSFMKPSSHTVKLVQAAERAHRESLLDETSSTEKKDMSRRTEALQPDSLLNATM